MEHLVRFTTPEGREGQHPAESLDEALRFVERLRNAEGTTDVRVFRMQEVVFEFKPYYRVELGAGEATPGGDGDPLPVPPGEARAGDDHVRSTPQLPRPLAGADSARPVGPAGLDAPAPVATEGGRRLFGR